MTLEKQQKDQVFGCLPPTCETQKKLIFDCPTPIIAAILKKKKFLSFQTLRGWEGKEKTLVLREKRRLQGHKKLKLSDLTSQLQFWPLIWKKQGANGESKSSFFTCVSAFYSGVIEPQKHRSQLLLPHPWVFGRAHSLDISCPRHLPALLATQSNL